MVQNANATDPHVPQELIRAIRQKECILMVGPGLSRYVRTDIAGFPPVSWEDTMHDLINICRRYRDINQSEKRKLDTLLANKSILLAGRELQNYLRVKDQSQALLQKRLEEVLLCTQAKVGKVHLLLAQIPFCLYCTINYDKFIEDAYLQIYNRRLSTFDLSLIEDARLEYLAARRFKTAEQKLIMKLLGDIDRTTSLNLSDRYLEAWVNENEERAQDLEDIFLETPILFIGFESDDADLKGLIGNRVICNSASQFDQYYILLEGQSERDLIMERIRAIWYGSEADLLKILESIAISSGALPLSTGEDSSNSGQQPLHDTYNERKPSLQKTGPVHIFISWTLKDEIPKEELVKHLNMLKNRGEITIWCGDFQLGLGKNFQIEENLNKAELFLPLISADYFDDKDCIRELDIAIQKYNEHKLRLIPVLIRAYNWEIVFKDLDLPSILPKNRSPIIPSEMQDQAYVSVVEGVKQVVEELRIKSSMQRRTG